MTVASRTPEGSPGRCPLCGAKVALDFSEISDDAPCPACGHLIWKANALAEHIKQLMASQLSLGDLSFDDDLGLATDSLDVVELAMEFEEEFGITIPDEDYEKLKSINDLARYIERRLRNNDSLDDE